MPRSLPPILGALFLACLVTAQEPEPQEQPGRPEPPPPAEGTARTLLLGAITMDLPMEWRSLTPNEALDLLDSAPYPLHDVRPGAYEIYGRVDAWLTEGFDGEALVIGRKDGERPVDETNLAELTEYANQVDPGGNRRTMRSGKIGAVGFDDHPAFLFEIDYETEDRGTFRLFETFASTVGDEYLIQHLTVSTLEGAEEKAATLRSAMRFVAPPEDPEELPDRLLDAALVGGAIGLLLIGLRALIRKPDAPEG